MRCPRIVALLLAIFDGLNRLIGVLQGILVAPPFGAPRAALTSPSCAAAELAAVWQLIPFFGSVDEGGTHAEQNRP